MDGPDLLLRFRERRCEEAFTGLVKRYANLIYSVAKRRLGDAQQAEDAAQDVFLRLAQAPPELRTESEVLGWLHRTTVHVSIDAWRSRSRRQAREESAAITLPPNDPTTSAAAWSQIQPDLDEAITQLGDTDREAILLRFFQEKPMRAIGDTLRISEAAAKMRVGRAVEHLRGLLVDRGITSVSAVALAALLHEHSVEAAPATCLARLAGTQLPRAPLESSTNSPSERSPLPRTLPGPVRSLFLQHPWACTSAALLLVGAVLVLDLGRSAPAPTELGVDPAPTGNGAGRPKRPLRLAANDPTADAQGNPSLAFAGPDAPAPANLEDLEKELRSLLHEPAPATRYPPPELANVLARFGDHLGRAVPILVEALQTPDHETRAWASAGLSRVFQNLRGDPHLRGSLDAAYAAAAPTLSALLRNPGEPGLLRMNALTALATPIALVVDGRRTEPAPLHPEARNILLAAVSEPRVGRDGFGFTILDQLRAYLDPSHPESHAFLEALRPGLSDASPERRLLSAYGLAATSPELRTQIQSELTAALQERGTDSYRAAQALGRLGPDARDSVPALLEFATSTEGWGDGGYARSAREAACRIDPALRSRYPEIDQRLKQEEAAAIPSATAATPAPTPGQVVLQAYRTRGQTPLFLHQSGEAFDAIRRSMLASLETEMERAPVENRAEILQAMEWARGLEKPAELENPPPPPTRFGDLTITARVLAIDEANLPSPTVDEVRFSEFLERFEKQQGGMRADTTVTAENFEALSRALREFDAGFEEKWRQALRRDLPGLDRTVPALRR